MPADWTIDHWPVCGSHAFLSHVAEDRETLVLPVLEKLQSHKVICWLDQLHYPTGRDSHDALRDSLLRCRHLIYFITPAMLKQGRGWTAIESAYGDLIQQQLNLPTSTLVQFELPLFFVPITHPGLQRTSWRRLADRGAFHRFGRKAVAISPVDWAVQQIIAFIQREADQAMAVASRLPLDISLNARCQRDRNFANRLLAITPDQHPVPV